MDNPGARASIRAFFGTLWAVIAFCLATYTSLPAELIGLLSGVWMASIGAGEAWHDSRLGRRPA